MSDLPVTIPELTPRVGGLALDGDLVEVGNADPLKGSGSIPVSSLAATPEAIRAAMNDFLSEDCYLNAGNGGLSLQYDARRAYNSAGLATVRWEDQELWTDTVEPFCALSWQGGVQTYDTSGGQISADFNIRQFFGLSGYAVGEYSGDGFVFRNYNNNTVAEFGAFGRNVLVGGSDGVGLVWDYAMSNFEFRNIDDNWVVAAFGVGSCYINDQNGYGSVQASNRQLKDSSGVNAFQWQNGGRRIYNGTGQFVAAFDNSFDIFAPGTGQAILNGSSGGIILYSTTNGQQVANFTACSLRSLTDGVESIGWRNSGAQIARRVSFGSSTLSGAGAIPITHSLCKLTTTGASQALTLANGAEDGQILTIIHDVDGGSGVLTPTTKTGYTTVTFTNAGDTVTLQFVTTRGWMIIASRGVTIA